MKKHTLSFIAVAVLASVLTGCSHRPSQCMKAGAPEITANTKPMMTTPDQANTSNTRMLVLYAQPSMNSTVLGQITPQTQFNYQPIFRNGTWFEVMNVQNGQVGWINMKDQIEAAQKRQAAAEQQIQNAQQAAMRQMQEMQLQQQQWMQDMQKMATAPAINPTDAQNYQSTKVSYSGNGTGNATVTTTWKDKDGKLQTKTMQIPADKMRHLEIVNGQVVSS